MANEGQYRHQTSTLVQNINGELTCGICLELFTAPVMLPCSHNFCQQCINGVIDANLSLSDLHFGPPTTFHCPLCHHVVQLDRYQFNKWPVNRALENIVELYKTNAPCEIFDDAWYFDLEPTISKCKRHDKPLDKFCDSCTVAICSACEKSEHSSQRAKHRVEPVKHAVLAYQTDIANSLTDLKKKLMPLNDRMNKLEGLLREIQENADQKRKQVEEKFSELMKLTRSKQSDLLHKIDIEVQKQTQPITEDLNQCRSVQYTVQDLINKLSHIRRKKDTTLLLQLMKNAYKQLDSLTGLDIDHCLRNQIQHSSTSHSYDLCTQDANNALANLDWETGSRRGKDLSEDVRNVSIHTQTVDIDMETMNLAEDNHSDAKVQNSKLSDIDHATGKSFKSNSSNTSATSSESLRGNSLDKKCLDEPDGDLHASGGDGLFNVGDCLAGSHSSNKDTDKHMQFQQDQKRSDRNEQVLSKHLNDLDLGDVSPGVKGRSSFPMDVRTTSWDRDEKNLNVQSSGKGKHSASDNSHAAAIKSFVARRRTMSPSVSTTGLESMSKSLSREKLSLGPEAARRNASSPALRSLEASFEDVDTNGNKEQAGSKQSKEAKGASGGSALPAKTNPTSSAGTVSTKSSQNLKPSTSGMNTTHSPKQKSYTTKPIDLNLDLNLDVDGPPGTRITNV